jgi:hypothetical protein
MDVAPWPFNRLRAVLTDDGAGDRADRARKALHCKEFERAALAGQSGPKLRLKQLAALAQTVDASDLIPHVREQLSGDIDRLAVRLLYHLGLLGADHRKADPLAIALTLLDIAAERGLVRPPTGRMLLDRVKVLVRDERQAERLQQSPDLNEHFQRQMAAADAALGAPAAASA